MSNRLTFSLASLILILAFGLIVAPVSVMAHDLDSDTEGLQHQESNGPTLIQDDHDAQHNAAPKVASIELVDVKIGATKADRDMADAESTVMGRSVRLVDDVDADDTTAIEATDLTGTDVGQFRVKIMFDADVYNSRDATTIDEALSDANDLTITARASSGGPNIFGDSGIVIPSAGVVRVEDDTSTTDISENLRGFYVTLQVPATLFGGDEGEASDLPIDVWIRVNAGAVESLTGLNDNGVSEYGTDNVAGTGDTTLDAAMLPKKFTVVAGFPVAVTAMDNGPVKGGEDIEVTLTATTGTLPTLAATDFTVMEDPTQAESGELTPDVSGAMLTITPHAANTADSTVTIELTDAGKIKVSGITTISVTVDRTDPVVTVGSPTPAEPMAGQMVSVPVSFTGAATGEVIDHSEVSVTQVDVTDPLSHTLTTDATGVTVAFTPTAAGNVTVTVEADAVMDAAGNGNAAESSDPAITVTAAPADPVAVMATAAAATVNGSTPIVITLSATAPAMVPSDLMARHFSVMEGTTALTPVWDGTANTLTITPASTGTPSGTPPGPPGPPGTSPPPGTPASIGNTIVTVNPSTDGMAKISFAQVSVRVDRIGPMVEFGSPMPAMPMAGDEVMVAISVDSTVATGAIALGHITVTQTDTDGNQSNLDRTYNANTGVTFTPTAAGTVTVTVAADAVTDMYGNGNMATDSTAITVAPAREAVAVMATAAAATVNGSTSIVVTLSATAPAMVPTDLMAADFSVMEGTTALTPVWDGTANTLTITPAGTGDTTVTVDPSTAGMEKISFAQVSVMVDRTGPMVTFSSVTGAKVNAAVMVTITVTGAAATEAIAVGDIGIVQTVGQVTTALTPTYNPTTGVVSFTPTAESTVTVSVDADAVMDAVGNGNAAASSAAIRVGAADVVDETPPTLMPTVGAPDANGAIVVTLAFNEALKAAPTVTHAASTGIANTYAVSAVTMDTANANTYMVTVTPSAATTADIPMGTVTLTVSAMDMADNAISTGNTVAVTLAARTLADTTAPMLTATVGDADATTGARVVTLAFNEALKAAPTVTHAASEGIADTYAVSAVTMDAANANTYMVTVTPTAATTANIPEGTVTLTVSAMDMADNAITTGNTVDVMLAARMIPPKNEIAAQGYRVIVGPGFDAATLPGVATVEVAGFPMDLAAFLIAGGTIDVVATGGTLRINELMVAKDSNKLGALPGEPTDGQWIELWNMHATEAATGITVHFSSAKPAPAKPTGTQDRFSNTAGQGWNFEGKFGAAVLNGSTHATNPVNFLSIRRTNYGDGANPGHWGTAIATLLFAPGRVGTPGAKNTIDVFSPQPNDRPIKNEVIISEVANRMNDSTEWIELKGPAGKNLKGWQLSVVTAVNTETPIYKFTTDIKISSNGHLLLTDVNPINGELEADFANGVHTPSRYVTVTLGALPNEGDFLLILRHRQDRNGSHEGIEDIAGYAGNLGVANPHKTLWPLRGNAGHINNRNRLAVGKVYLRIREGIHGYSQEGNHGDRPAFGAVGFTGLGYDRNAPAIAENGGTPGYPHGNFKGDGADAPGHVIISEIMFATGNGGPARNRNLPQWIEIHNMSDVNSVNLTNWRLEVVNSERMDDTGTRYDGKLSENIDLSGTIPPNQTYLIVEHTASSLTRLPRERVKIVGKKFNESLLNPYGFHLTLKAKRHKAAHEQITVDTAGNLNEPTDARRVDSRSYAGNAWELSALGDVIAADNSRISISRRINLAPHKNPGAVPGTKKYAWVLTDEDKRYSGLIQLTYYGRTDDRATPGYTIGGALPVRLSKFSPERLDDGTIVIRWLTESELDNAGFNILRSETRDGQFTKLNTQLIAGQGTTSERTAYEFVDKTAKPNVVYYYQIQDVSLDGDVATLRTTRLRGHISADGKATTTWGELKTLQ